MVSRNLKLPLIVIVGPTASGKTALAIDLAKQFNGEIICADSRTIYKGMTIGTAKPTREERQGVPHWGLDLVEPGERFTAADFQEYTRRKIREIRQRNRMPFLVGGTGLYIDGVVFNYEFDSHYNPELRSKLAEMTQKELIRYCIENNIKPPENDKNERYLIRAIERKIAQPKRDKVPISSSIIVGISTDKEILRARIGQRTEQLFNDGVVKEASMLSKKYGWNSEAMTGNIYPLIREYLQSRLTLDEVKERFNNKDWQLARRQLTWFKRNPFVKWGTLEEVRFYLLSELANEWKA